LMQELELGTQLKEGEGWQKLKFALEGTFVDSAVTEKNIIRTVTGKDGRIHTAGSNLLLYLVAHGAEDNFELQEGEDFHMAKLYRNLLKMDARKYNQIFIILSGCCSAIHAGTPPEALSIRVLTSTSLTCGGTISHGLRTSFLGVLPGAQFWQTAGFPQLKGGSSDDIPECGGLDRALQLLYTHKEVAFFNQTGVNRIDSYPLLADCINSMAKLRAEAGDQGAVASFKGSEGNPADFLYYGEAYKNEANVLSLCPMCPEPTTEESAKIAVLLPTVINSQRQQEWRAAVARRAETAARLARQVAARGNPKTLILLNERVRSPRQALLGPK